MASVERISVFDILKIGIGPSSSHTLGPWRAVQRFLDTLKNHHSKESSVTSVQVHLYGSLAKTGRGHGTDKAIILSLQGYDPETIDTSAISSIIQEIEQQKKLLLLGKYPVPFDSKKDLIYHFSESLPFHPNGMRCQVVFDQGGILEETFYSVGGGFVVKEGEALNPKEAVTLPYPCNQPADLLTYCHQTQSTIAALVWQNELVWRDEPTVRTMLLRIWTEMKECAFRGCHASGNLPGGLNTSRRAPAIYQKLMGEETRFDNADDWLNAVMQKTCSFQQTLKWISCFAIAVNEENAAFGRVVTAPTNGASGVIPAVLLYYLCFILRSLDEQQIINFLLVCGEVGSYYKKGATISAAMGGCQAEIGVSSSMAAAALTECQGGTVEQAFMAAEIAMEHHLGLTCDPVGGLVQVPCIERNAMGAVKAINASEIAIDSDPKNAKVSLDNVIKTMWQTAQDMNDKYKETSEGGLAIHIPVSLPEC